MNPGPPAPQASVLSKLDHGPSGRWGTVPRYEVFSFLNSLTPFMSVTYSNSAFISCFASLTVFVKNVGKTKLSVLNLIFCFEEFSMNKTEKLAVVD